MLDRDERRDERQLKRLEQINIAGSLPPSVSLLSDLVEFLNETKTSRGKKIVMILEQMLQLEDMTRPIPPEEPMIAALEWKRTDPKKFKVHWEIEKRRATLQRELSKYRFTPHAEVMIGGGGQGASQWAVWWRGEHNAKREKHLRMVTSEALEMILKLTQLGDLTRLRRCRLCKKWLFARFRHQYFCSTKCQQKSYTQTDEWKEHRRRYMRDRYRLLTRLPHLGRRKRWNFR
jgi:hypothetical protein